MRLSGLRKYGTIPSRRHDAFLLALFIAFGVNAAFFAVQQIIPKISALLTYLAAEPRMRFPGDQPEYSFILVPASESEELEHSDNAAAMAQVSRLARQPDPRDDLPESGLPIMEKGINEILTTQIGAPAFVPQEAAMPLPMVTESSDTGMIRPQEPSPENPGVGEPAEPEIPLEPPAIRSGDLPGTMPDPESPAARLAGDPHEIPPVPEPSPTTRAVETTTEDPAREPDRNSEELASLPASLNGFAEALERRQPVEAARPPIDTQPPEMLPPDRETLAPKPHPEETLDRENPDMQPPERREMNHQAQPAQPREAREASRPRPEPVFKKIGTEIRAAGAPRKKNGETSVRLFGEEPEMKALAHKWGPYMAKLARQLQESLNRQMVLAPMNYGEGVVRIRFGIAPDGALSYFTPLRPDPDQSGEQLISEQMLREAAPFEPLTPEMRLDENFQRLTVHVYFR